MARVVFAVLAGAIGVTGASKKHLFREETEASDPACDCTCYGDVPTSNGTACLCTTSTWQACINGFGQKPRAMGPETYADSAACCPYDWKFLSDKGAQRLSSFIRATVTGELVAKIDVSLNFALRWTMVLDTVPVGVQNVFHIFPGGGGSSSLTLDVGSQKRLTLTFGNPAQALTVVESNLSLSVGQFSNFELFVQDCPQPNCVVLRDSNGMQWLSSQSPIISRVVWPNAEVYLSGPNRSRANVRVQNFHYTPLPFNAEVFTGFPLTARALQVDQRKLLSIDGQINYFVTFDLTVVSTPSSQQTAFVFKEGGSSGTAGVSVKVGADMKMTVTVPTYNSTNSSGTTLTTISAGRLYSFVLRVQDALVELIEIQPQQAMPPTRRNWLSFGSAPSDRIVTKNLFAFVCDGSGNNSSTSCPDILIGNFVHTRMS